jgi:DNA-directed RNA polymerase specialized sigma24 family protein
MIPMPSPISGAELAVLSREADAAARRLVRQLRCPRHELEDLRQEILVDLIGRMAAYDPRRGSLGAFAGIVVKHKSASLRAAAASHRALFGSPPISLDAHPQEGEPLHSALSEADGYGSLFGQVSDWIGDLERRIAILQSLAFLSAADRGFCAELAQAGVDELVVRGLGARTSLYRRIARIRTALKAAGGGDALNVACRAARP